MKCTVLIKRFSNLSITQRAFTIQVSIHPFTHTHIRKLMPGGYTTKCQSTHQEFTHKDSHTTDTATSSNLGFSILPSILWDRRNQIRSQLVDNPLYLVSYSSALRLSQSVCKCPIGLLVLPVHVFLQDFGWRSSACIGWHWVNMENKQLWAV